MANKKPKHPAKVQNQTEIQAFTVQGQMFSGPLPPPEILARYNEIIPNGADRIMVMAERQGEHRRKQEDRVIRGNVRAQFMGSIFAFVVTLAVIGLGGYLIYIGRGVSGLVAIIGALVGLVALFAAKRSSQNKELREKRAGLPVKQ